MTWPQIVVLVLLLFGLQATVRGYLANKHQSHAAVVGSILFSIALTGGYAWVLHAGGFW